MPTADIYTYISATLHMVAQVLMIPVMIALAALIIFALYSVGSLIMETFTERNHFRVNSPVIIKAIHDAEASDLEKVIRRGHLLKPQCSALITVIRNIDLDEDELFALARTQIEKVNDRYKRTLSRSEQVTKIAPMLGLMCTLIPLGPGIVAMGQGNVAELSMSLLIAFDGTVAGLVAAVVAMIVTGIRKRWYANYLVVLESLMTAILSKAQNVKAQNVKVQNVKAQVSKEQNVNAQVSKEQNANAQVSKAGESQ